MAEELTIGGGSSQITVSQAIELLSLITSLTTKIVEAAQAGKTEITVDEEKAKLEALLLRSADEVIAEAQEETTTQNG